MPLRDHFRPPLRASRPWEGVHSRWASAIGDQLNRQLPPRYFAMPNTHAGGRVEVDVATFEELSAGTSGIAVATAPPRVWSPTRPQISVEIETASFDTFEVQIVDEGFGRLVAAIELVSPANKDRPASRRAFAVKCAAYLQSSVSVIVVDVVTDHAANLHEEMLDVMRLNPAAAANPHSLSAAAYRIAPTAHPTLDVWLSELRINGTLPTLPLWLTPRDALPVDLEESYTTTCRALRISD